MQSYFQDMATKVEAVQNNLNKLQSQMEDMWQTVWDDRTGLKEAFAHFNHTPLLVHRDVKLPALASGFERSKKVFLELGILGSAEKEFNDRMQFLAEKLADFVSTSKVMDTYVQ